MAGAGVDLQPAKIKRLSRDFHWFSPVLNQQLEGKQADAVVRPRDEEELRQLVAACVQQQLPLTLRGGHRQLWPAGAPRGRSAGRYDRPEADLRTQNGTVRAQAGIRPAEIEDATRPTGWELRCMPSTFRLASLGGLYCGGFGGIGSINYGPGGARQCAQRQSDDRGGLAPRVDHSGTAGAAAASRLRQQRHHP
ncbi:hypothetical protein DMH27_07975 [Raoultella planticola]|nr:hypothetical protein [Raoultella planticola]